MHIYRRTLFLTLYCIFPHVISYSEGTGAGQLKTISEHDQIEANLEAYGGSTKGLLGIEKVHDNIFHTLIPPESLQTTNLTENERNAISTSFTRNSANNNRTLQLEKVGFSSSSTFYVQKNRTLPDNLLTSFSNRTEVLSVDLFHENKNSWTLMNSKTAEGINANATQPDPKHPHHRDNFVPPGGWWGSPFYWPTVGIYISTDHYGSPWKSSFAGNYSFSDDKQLGSFFELNGTYACYESANYSAVQIPLNKGKQVLHLVLPSPNISVVDLYIGGIYTNKTRNPAVTDLSLQSRRVQLPAIDITSWTREFTIADPGLADLKIIVCRTTKYCLGPIPRAQYLKFRPDSFEVSSATGTTVRDQELPLLQEEDEKSNKQRSLSRRAAANDFDVQGRTASTPQHEILRFDKPFAWYLTNEGDEIYSGIVNPSHIVQTQPVGFEWLTSIEKGQLWSGVF